jgi:hypothetical protein
MKLTINKSKFKLLTKNKKCSENIEVEISLQTKTVTPTETSQEITPDTDYAGLKKVTVDAIPYGYVKPSGTVTFTKNGTYDILNSKTAVVNVSSVTQEKTVTPTKSSQVITPDTSYDGLSKVTVNAIPTEYIVPSGTLNITENGTHDVTSKASVVVNISSGPTSEEWDGSYTESDLGYTVTLEGSFGSTNYGYLSYQVNGGEVISCEGKTSPIVIEGVQNIAFTKSGVSSSVDMGTTTGGSDVGSVYDGQPLTYVPTQNITLYCNEVAGGSRD